MAVPAQARARRKGYSGSREHGRCMAATRLKIARAAMIRDLKAEAKRLVELI
jgi:hypothetical protein